MTDRPEHPIDDALRESQFSEAENQLADALVEYEQKIEAGLTPDIEDLVRRFPLAADDIRAVISGKRFLAGAIEDAAAVGSRVSSSVAPQIIGDFEIIREIGRGGMGVVYKARQQSLDRIVALKVLSNLTGVPPAMVKRFEQESHAAAVLKHPNIVPVHSRGSTDGVYYYAMDLIEGISLGQVLADNPTALTMRPTQTPVAINSDPGATTSIIFDDRETTVVDEASGIHDSIYGTKSHAASLSRPPRTFRRIASLIADVADALQHAHDHGIIHRDIKPQNLLLGSDDKLHITDFGLARLTSEPGVTVTGEFVGTPLYMAPEQIRGEDIDHRTDTYALGVTLYELLTLIPPFTGKNRQQILNRILHTEPVSPKKIDSRIPRDIETICLRAMEKTPAKRFQSAGDFAGDLRRFLNNVPITSRPVGGLERTFKWLRRHPVMVAGGVAVIALMAFAAATIWSAQLKDWGTAEQQKKLDEMSEKGESLYREARTALFHESFIESADALDTLKVAEQSGVDPVNVNILRAFGHIAHDREVAKAAVDSALGIDPENIEAIYLAAWLENLNLNHAAASRWLQNADELGGPQTASEHFLAGRVWKYYDSNRAVLESKAAVQLEPHAHQYRTSYAFQVNWQMYHTRSDEHYDHVRSLIDPTGEILPLNAWEYHILATAHKLAAEIAHDRGDSPEVVQRRYERAFTQARNAQSKFPQSYHGFRGEADCWMSKGMRALETDEVWMPTAERLLSQVLEKPDAEGLGYTDALFYRFRIRLWKHSYDDALQDIELLMNTSRGAGDRRYELFWRPLIIAQSDHATARNTVANGVHQSLAAGSMSCQDAVTLFSAVGVIGSLDAARAFLDSAWSIVNTEEHDGNMGLAGWSQNLRQFCMGEKQLSELISFANSNPREAFRRRAEAYFLAAAVELARNHQSEALKHLNDCSNQYDSEEYAHHAQNLLQLLEHDPDWLKFPSSASD